MHFVLDYFLWINKNDFAAFSPEKQQYGHARVCKLKYN